MKVSSTSQRALNSLKMEDLSPEMELIAQLCGIEIVKQLIDSYGGLRFYVPKLSHNKDLVSRYINNNISTNNWKLALELGVSISYVSKIKKKLLKEAEI